MKRYLIVILFTLFIASGCFFDPFGFFLTTDIEKRFNQSRTLPEVTNLIVSIPFSVVVITDTHVYGTNNRNFYQLSNQIIASDSAILISGDVAQQGAAEDYVYLKVDLNKIGLPYYAVPGNHDLYYGGWENFKTHMGRNCFTFVAGNTRFIGLDSASGSLGQSQMNWLENVLKNKTEVHTVVFTHMEFFNPSLGQLQQFTDIEEIYHLMYIFENNEVDMVISGHSHQNLIHEINGVRYINFEDFADKGSIASYGRIFISNDNISWNQYSLPLPE